MNFIILLCLSTFALGDGSEYLVKAAFIHKFTLFIEFPGHASIASQSGFNICILGQNPFGDAFSPVEGKPVNGRPLMLRNLSLNASDTELKQCNVLFLVSGVADSRQQTVLKSLRYFPTLTIGEHEDFLQMGGIIRLYRKQDRIVFSVNAVAAKRAGIQIRSQMLRVAEYVIHSESDR